MTGLLKRKPKIHYKFKKELTKFQKTGFDNIGVTMYKNRQVLVQIELSKFYIDKGLSIDNENDFCLLLFFNRNKTETWSEYARIKDSEILTDFLYFEEPKGIHNYVVNLGFDSNEIEKYTNRIINNLFELKRTDKLGIDFRAD